MKSSIGASVLSGLVEASDAAEPTVEAVALSGIEKTMWHSRSRIRNDPVLAAQLGNAMRDLLDVVWPAKPTVPARDYLAAVRTGIDRIPARELDVLVQRMERAIEAMLQGDAAKKEAAELFAGWMKARSVELRGEGVYKHAARQLRADHELLFARLLLGS